MKATKLSMKARNSIFLAAWEVRAVKSWKCLAETPDDTSSSLSSKATRLGHVHANKQFNSKMFEGWVRI
jgi:hypothetical protein